MAAVVVLLNTITNSHNFNFTNIVLHSILDICGAVLQYYGMRPGKTTLTKSLNFESR
jgi:hypothetical protein